MSDEVGLTVFTQQYAKEALWAQLQKDPKVFAFKGMVEPIFRAAIDRVLADGFVICKAADEGTKAKMLALEKNGFIAFRNGGNQ
jgi:hypothetical protein